MPPLRNPAIDAVSGPSETVAVAGVSHGVSGETTSMQRQLNWPHPSCQHVSGDPSWASGQCGRCGVADSGTTTGNQGAFRRRLATRPRGSFHRGPQQPCDGCPQRNTDYSGGEESEERNVLRFIASCFVHYSCERISMVSARSILLSVRAILRSLHTTRLVDGTSRVTAAPGGPRSASEPLGETRSCLRLFQPCDRLTQAARTITDY